jgi:hypothetical protein
VNDLFIDIGYGCLYKEGEQLCGDQVVVERINEGSAIAVLADGMGSGVKANILATLTSKILSTMLANSIEINECVATVAATPAHMQGKKGSLLHLHRHTPSQTIQKQSLSSMIILMLFLYTTEKTLITPSRLC